MQRSQTDPGSSNTSQTYSPARERQQPGSLNDTLQDESPPVQYGEESIFSSNASVKLKLLQAANSGGRDAGENGSCSSRHDQGESDMCDRSQVNLYSARHLADVTRHVTPEVQATEAFTSHVESENQVLGDSGSHEMGDSGSHEMGDSGSHELGGSGSMGVKATTEAAGNTSNCIQTMGNRKPEFYSPTRKLDLDKKLSSIGLSDPLPGDTEEPTTIKTTQNPLKRWLARKRGKFQPVSDVDQSWSVTSKSHQKITKDKNKQDQSFSSKLMMKMGKKKSREAPASTTGSWDLALDKGNIPAATTGVIFPTMGKGRSRAAVTKENIVVLKSTGHLVSHNVGVVDLSAAENTHTESTHADNRDTENTHTESTDADNRDTENTNNDRCQEHVSKDNKANGHDPCSNVRIQTCNEGVNELEDVDHLAEHIYANLPPSGCRGSGASVPVLGRQQTSDIDDRVQQGQVDIDSHDTMSTRHMGVVNLTNYVKTEEMGTESKEGTELTAEISVENMGDTVQDGEISVENMGDTVQDGEISVGNMEDIVQDGEISVENMRNTVNDGEISVENMGDTVQDGEISVESIDNTVGGGKTTVGARFDQINGGKTTVGARFDQINGGETTVGSRYDQVEEDQILEESRNNSRENVTSRDHTTDVGHTAASTRFSAPAHDVDSCTLTHELKPWPKSVGTLPQPHRNGEQGSCTYQASRRRICKHVISQTVTTQDVKTEDVTTLNVTTQVVTTQNVTTQDVTTHNTEVHDVTMSTSETEDNMQPPDDVHSRLQQTVPEVTDTGWYFRVHDLKETRSDTVTREATMSSVLQVSSPKTGVRHSCRCRSGELCLGNKVTERVEKYQTGHSRVRIAFKFPTGSNGPYNMMPTNTRDIAHVHSTDSINGSWSRHSLSYQANSTDNVYQSTSTDKNLCSSTSIDNSVYPSTSTDMKVYPSTSTDMKVCPNTSRDNNVYPSASTDSAYNATTTSDSDVWALTGQTLNLSRGNNESNLNSVVTEIISGQSSSTAWLIHKHSSQSPVLAPQLQPNKMAKPLIKPKPQTSKSCPGRQEDSTPHAQTGGVQWESHSHVTGGNGDRLAIDRASVTTRQIQVTLGREQSQEQHKIDVHYQTSSADELIVFQRDKGPNVHQLPGRMIQEEPCCAQESRVNDYSNKVKDDHTDDDIVIINNNDCGGRCGDVGDHCNVGEYCDVGDCGDVGGCCDVGSGGYNSGDAVDKRIVKTSTLSSSDTERSTDNASKNESNHDPRQVTHLQATVDSTGTQPQDSTEHNRHSLDTSTDTQDKESIERNRHILDTRAEHNRHISDTSAEHNRHILDTTTYSSRNLQVNKGAEVTSEAATDRQVNKQYQLEVGKSPDNVELSMATDEKAVGGTASHEHKDIDENIYEEIHEDADVKDVSCLTSKRFQLPWKKKDKKVDKRKDLQTQDHTIAKERVKMKTTKMKPPVRPKPVRSANGSWPPLQDHNRMTSHTVVGHGVRPTAFLPLQAPESLYHEIDYDCHQRIATIDDFKSKCDNDVEYELIGGLQTDDYHHDDEDSKRRQGTTRDGLKPALKCSDSLGYEIPAKFSLKARQIDADSTEQHLYEPGASQTPKMADADRQTELTHVTNVCSHDDVDQETNSCTNQPTPPASLAADVDMSASSHVHIMLPAMTEVFPQSRLDTVATCPTSHTDHTHHADHPDHTSHTDHTHHADHPGHTSHTDHTDHTNHPDHTSHTDHTHHADHPDHTSHTDHTHHADHPDHTSHTDHTDHPDHTSHTDHTHHADHPDHTSHTDHTHHADHPDRTSHTDHADHPDHTSHTDHTHHTDHPDHTNHTDHTYHPDHTNHTDHPDHTDHTDHTYHTDHTDHTNHTDHTDHPDHTDHTDHTYHPDHTYHTYHPDHTYHTDHTDHTNHTDHTDHPDHTNHTDHTDHPDHTNHTDHPDHTDHTCHPRDTDHHIGTGSPEIAPISAHCQGSRVMVTSVVKTADMRHGQSAGSKTSQGLSTGSRAEITRDASAAECTKCQSRSPPVAGGRDRCAENKDLHRTSTDTIAQIENRSRDREGWQTHDSTKRQTKDVQTDKLISGFTEEDNNASVSLPMDSADLSIEAITNDLAVHPESTAKVDRRCQILMEGKGHELSEGYNLVVKSLAAYFGARRDWSSPRSYAGSLGTRESCVRDTLSTVRPNVQELGLQVSNDIVISESSNYLGEQEADLQRSTQTAPGMAVHVTSDRQPSKYERRRSQNVLFTAVGETDDLPGCINRKYISWTDVHVGHARTMSRSCEGSVHTDNHPDRTSWQIIHRRTNSLPTRTEADGPPRVAHIEFKVDPFSIHQSFLAESSQKTSTKMVDSGGKDSAKWGELPELVDSPPAEIEKCAQSFSNQKEVTMGTCGNELAWLATPEPHRQYVATTDRVSVTADAPGEDIDYDLPPVRTKSISQTRRLLWPGLPAEPAMYTSVRKTNHNLQVAVSNKAVYAAPWGDTALKTLQSNLAPGTDAPQQHDASGHDPDCGQVTVGEGQVTDSKDGARKMVGLKPPQAPGQEQVQETRRMFGKSRDRLPSDDVGDGHEDATRTRKSAFIRLVTSLFQRKKDRFTISEHLQQTDHDTSASSKSEPAAASKPHQQGVREQDTSPATTTPGHHKGITAGHETGRVGDQTGEGGTVTEVRPLCRVLRVDHEKMRTVELLQPWPYYQGLSFTKVNHQQQLPGQGVFVAPIVDKNSRKLLAGFLDEGDRLLEINGVDVSHMALDDIHSVIQSNQGMVIKVLPANVLQQ